MRGGIAFAACCCVFALAVPTNANVVAGTEGASSPRAWLGVKVQDSPHGAAVVELFPGYPASMSGLAVGDEIVSVDGRRVLSSDGLSRLLLSDYRAGDEVALVFVRAGRRLHLTLKLETYPTDAEMFRRRWVGRKAAPLVAWRANPSVNSSKRSVGTFSSHGRAVVLAFVGRDCVTVGCERLIQDMNQLAASDKQGLDIWLVQEGGRLDLGHHLRGPALFSDPVGFEHAKYHVSQTPALLVLDRDGWVRFAEQGERAQLQFARPHVEQALRSQHGLALDMKTRAADAGAQ